MKKDFINVFSYEVRTGGFPIFHLFQISGPLCSMHSTYVLCSCQSNAVLFSNMERLFFLGKFLHNFRIYKCPWKIIFTLFTMNWKFQFPCWHYFLKKCHWKQSVSSKYIECEKRFDWELNFWIFFKKDNPILIESNNNFGKSFFTIYLSPYITFLSSLSVWWCVCRFTLS